MRGSKCERAQNTKALGGGKKYRLQKLQGCCFYQRPLNDNDTISHEGCMMDCENSSETEMIGTVS